MKTFLALLMLLLLSVGLQILVMVNGWGLKPVSWGWIIGAGVFINAVIQTIAKKIDW